MKAIDQLRKLFLNDLRKIPYFINTKSAKHKAIFDYLQIIIRVLSRLSNESVLSQRTIKEYNDQTEECIRQMLELAKDDEILELELSWYILDLLDKYEQRALELELYEVCENIKRYKTIYNAA
jgi:hypothetical protein